MSRPNRFIVECTVDRKNVIAYLPNPGRLRELLYQGSILYLVPQNSTSHKHRYMCTSHLFGMNNDPARSLLFVEMLLDFRINRLECVEMRQN